MSSIPCYYLTCFSKIILNLRKNSHSVCQRYCSFLYDQDASNILLLLFLYILQGIPLGLAGAVPLILQQYSHVSYKEQAFFSFVFWPFSLKLLWAPLVDATYWKKMGWRKSWLIPIQYFIGLLMLLLSLNVQQLISQSASSWGSLMILTSAFFLLNMLAATQDIAVDGWALTMLSRKNVGLASTCNSIGQTAGYFLGNIVFLALESPDFCNKYLRSIPKPHGVMTFADFLQFWGIVFMVTTTAVLIFKHEKSHFPANNSSNRTFDKIKDVYMTLWEILKLPHIRSYIVICLTMKIAFASDSVTGLKILDAGVKKETLAFLAVPFIPLQILFPLIINKYTDTQKPIDVVLRAYPFRLAIGVLMTLLVWWTNALAQLYPSSSPEFPTYYYIVLILIFALHEVASYSMYVAIMAFHAKISDPGVGGTYMTLLNTLSNLGGNWPSTTALGIVDNLDFKYCPRLSYFTPAFWWSCAFLTNTLFLSPPQTNNNTSTQRAAQSTLPNDTSTKLNDNLHDYKMTNRTINIITHSNLPQICQDCRPILDGYYVLSILCLFTGYLWLRFYQKKYKHLQNLPLVQWRVRPNNTRRRKLSREDGDDD